MTTHTSTQLLSVAVFHCKMKRFNTSCEQPAGVEVFHFCLLSPSSAPPLPQSFYSSLVKTPETYGVIFSHPAHLYHPTHMQAFAHTTSNLTHTQMEPVDLSVSKRSSSSNSSSSSASCSAASSPASSRSSPPSPYSSAGHASPPQSQLRSSPSHALSPPTPSIQYPTMVAPLMGSGSGVIQSSGVMMSPVMVPLSVLYPSPLHLHQPIMVSPPISGDDHHRSREHRKGEGTFIYSFIGNNLVTIETFYSVNFKTW